MIETTGLRKVYPGHHGHDEHVAVQNLTFRVDAGSALGIVGESGAGKTTVASLLMGFEVPTRGSIKINGKERPRVIPRALRKAWAQQIQIVFQHPYGSLDRHQRVGEAISEILRFHFDMPSCTRSDRTDHLLDAVGLSSEQRDALPAALSGGQRQRVAIAKALAVNPKILVLDEPVSALDVSIQAQVLNRLNDLRYSLGVTYVLISHDLGVVRYTTDRVIVMRQGAVVEEGDTRTVLDAPQHPYTRALRDAVPRPGWQPQQVTEPAQG